MRRIMAQSATATQTPRAAARAWGGRGCTGWSGRINNIAYLLRRFPFFFLPGDGSYKLQPVHVEDLDALAVEGVYSQDSYIVDAVGPDIFTFREMVQLIGEKIGARRPLIPVPPRLALLAAQFISLFVRDVVLTPEEVDGLMAGLLVSTDPPLGRIRLADWLEANKYQVGAQYASEMGKHYSEEPGHLHAYHC